MRILFVTSQFPPFTGGVSIATHRVAKGFADNGDDVFVFSRDKTPSASPGEARLTKQQVDGITLYQLPVSAFKAKEKHVALQCLKQVVDEVKPDVVHTYFCCAVGYVGRLCAYRANAPHVVSCRGNDMTKSTLLKPALIRTILNSADCVVGVSRSMLTWARVVSDFTRGEFIPNSIAPSFLRETQVSREISRDRWQLPQQVPTIGMVYRPDWKKGADYLRKILPQLGQSALPALNFVMIGDDSPDVVQDLQDSFTSQTPKHCQRQFIQIPNASRQRLPSLFRSLDLLLLLSRREGMPNTILEALACGTPVAATAVDGVVDVMENTNCGVLLDRFNHENGAQSILRLLQDPQRMTHMQRRGPQLIREKYLLKHELASIRDVYTSLLAERSARPESLESHDSNFTLQSNAPSL